MRRVTLAMFAVLVGVAIVASADAALAQAPKPAAQAPAPAAGAPRPKFVAPVRGEAEIGYTKPVTKVVANEVITTVQVKNLSTGAIAGLKLEEFWWDKANNPLGGDVKRLPKPLLPQEIATIELRTPKNPNMQRNNYNFSHANGAIKAKLLTKMD